MSGVFELVAFDTIVGLALTPSPFVTLIPTPLVATLLVVAVPSPVLTIIPAVAKSAIAVRSESEACLPSN